MITVLVTHVIVLLLSWTWITKNWLHGLWMYWLIYRYIDCTNRLLSYTFTNLSYSSFTLKICLTKYDQIHSLFISFAWANSYPDEEVTGSLPRRFRPLPAIPETIIYCHKYSIIFLCSLIPGSNLKIIYQWIIMLIHRYPPSRYVHSR